MSGGSPIRLVEAVAAVADRAACPNLSAEVRAAAPDEAAVLAAIASTVKDQSRMQLLGAGLFDAVVDHASGGFGALSQTGEALVVRTAAQAHHLVRRGLAAVTSPVHVARLDEPGDSRETPAAVVRAAGRTARASPGLHELVLDCASVPLEGVAALLRDVAASPWLGSLELSGPTIDLDNAAALAASLRAGGGLTSLALRQTYLVPHVVAVIARAAADSDTLQRLELTSCCLGHAGAAALGGVLATARSLTHLRVADDGFGDAGVASLARGLSRNASLTELVLSRTGFDTEGASALGEALASNSTLQKLDLGRYELWPAAVRALCKSLECWRGLRELRLRGAMMDEESALALGASLRRATSLTRLSARCLAVGPAGAAKLASALAAEGGSLSDLSLSLRDNAEGCADAIMAEVRGAREGSTLRLQVSGTIGGSFAAVVDGLPFCPGLRGLSFTHQSGTISAMRRIGEAMVRAPWLTELGLFGVTLGAKGGADLARGIAASTGLTRLSLVKCGMGRRGCGLAVAALEAVPSMRCLVISEDDLGDAGAASLGHLLPRWHQSLTELGLTKAGIGEEGMAGLAEGLGRCKGLTRLSVGLNSVGPEGVRALACAVVGCPSLSELDCRGLGTRRYEELSPLVGAVAALPALTAVHCGGGVSQTVAAIAACHRRDASRRRQRWRGRFEIVAWRHAASR